MKKRQADRFWIPFWVDKWIFGSMRIECTPEERGIWWDLYALAAKDDGFIRANEDIPYPIEQLSGMLIIPQETLEAAIEKFIKLKKITRLKNGCLCITKWEDYMFSDRHKRRIEAEMSAKPDTTSGKKDTITKNKITKNKKEKKKTKEEDEFPSWLPLDVFKDFIEMRKKIKKPMTDCAVKLAIKKLHKLKEEGHDPKAVLEQSIFRSWQGLFPVKDQDQVNRDSSWTKKYDGGDE